MFPRNPPGILFGTWCLFAFLLCATYTSRTMQLPRTRHIKSHAASLLAHTTSVVETDTSIWLATIRPLASLASGSARWCNITMYRRNLLW